MQQLIIPDGVEWEIVVIDNNSTDTTKQVVDSYATSLPIKYFFETKQGHCNARNRAIAEVKGDLILWTDDDVLVSNHWLAAYAEAAQTHLDASGFGGPIDPWYEGPPPNWVERNIDFVGAFFALRVVPEGVEEVARNHVPYGANMAFRTSALREYGFDPRLGRVKDQLISGDEVAVIYQMIEDGKRLRWVPDAKVEHFVPKKRMRLSFLRDCSYCRGRYEMPTVESQGVPTFFGMPRWLFRRYLGLSISVWSRRLLGRETGEWLKDYVQEHVLRGQLAASRTRTQQGVKSA